MKLLNNYLLTVPVWASDSLRTEQLFSEVILRNITKPWFFFYLQLLLVYCVLYLSVFKWLFVTTFALDVTYSWAAFMLCWAKDHFPLLWTIKLYFVLFILFYSVSNPQNYQTRPHWLQLWSSFLVSYLIAFSIQLQSLEILWPLVHSHCWVRCQMEFVTGGGVKLEARKQYLYSFKDGYCFLLSVWCLLSFFFCVTILVKCFLTQAERFLTFLRG